MAKQSKGSLMKKGGMKGAGGRGFLKKKAMTEKMPNSMSKKAAKY